MKKRQLEALAELEWDRLAAIHENLQGRSHTRFRDWYPELKLEQPYTSLNLHPFWIGLPYYKSLLFELYPFATEDILEGAHGVTARGLLSLQEQGKVHIILAGPHSIYEGLDYLDPVLAAHPPVYTYRNLAFHAHRHGTKQLAAWTDEARSLFSGKLERLRLQLGVSTDERAFEGSMAGAWINVRAMGLSDLADAIKNVAGKHVEVAATYLEVYHELLCAPQTSSLGGCHSSNSTYLSIAKRGGYTAGMEADDFPHGFPFEAGRMLAERYKLVRPRTLSDALEIYPDYEEARSALKSLAEYVAAAGSSSTVIDTSVRVAKAFEDVHKVKHRIKKFETAFQVTSVVGAAAAGLAGGGPGLLAGLGFGLLGTSVASPGAQALGRLTAPSSVVSLYDFDGSVSEKWTR